MVSQDPNNTIIVFNGQTLYEQLNSLISDITSDEELNDWTNCHTQLSTTFNLNSYPTDSELTCLGLIVKHGWLYLLDWLLKHDCHGHLQQSINADGQQALHFAYRYRQWSTVLYLSTLCPNTTSYAPDQIVVSHLHAGKLISL